MALTLISVHVPGQISFAVEQSRNAMKTTEFALLTILRQSVPIRENFHFGNFLLSNT